MYVDFDLFLGLRFCLAKIGKTEIVVFNFPKNRISASISRDWPIFLTKFVFVFAFFISQRLLTEMRIKRFIPL